MRIVAVSKHNVIFSRRLINRLFLLALQRETILKYNLEKPRFVKASWKQLRIVLRHIYKTKEQREIHIITNIKIKNVSFGVRHCAYSTLLHTDTTCDSEHLRQRTYNTRIADLPIGDACRRHLPFALTCK